MQAEVNTEDEEDEDETNQEGSPNIQQNPSDKLYPSAPLLDESSDGSTASAHSTSVWGISKTWILRGFHTIFLKKLTLNLSNNAATPNTKNKASNKTFSQKISPEM